MSRTISFLKTYLYSIVLILALISGGLFGFFYEHQAQSIRFLGDIFLNLIFTTIVPLIFFSVAAAISKTHSWHKLRQIFVVMFGVFLLTGIIAALLSLVVVKCFPIGQGILLEMPLAINQSDIHFSQKMVEIFTVKGFLQLFSLENMFALIVFSILVGIAATSENKNNKSFSRFLQSGEVVFMRVFSLIMYYAPIGFFAYFAALVAQLGPQIMKNYLHLAVVYYVFATLFFIFTYSAYAYLLLKKPGLPLYWKNILIPATTAIATCSSAATIPANLQAMKNMGIEEEIYETSIPLGTLIHKDGSIIGGVFKIAFLFAAYHMDFSGLYVYASAIGVSLLVGTVMGAIPSGGMIGELLILSLYGFPSSALITIAAISIIIDPIATLLNVTGNTISTLIISRIVNWKKNDRLS